MGWQEGGEEKQKNGTVHLDWLGYEGKTLERAGTLVMAPPGKNYLFYRVEEKRCVRTDLPKKEGAEGEVNVLSLATEEELFDP